MKRKAKDLFIGIMLSILFGHIAASPLFTSEAREIPFGTFAAPEYYHDCMPELEETMFMQSDTPSPLYATHTFRHFSQTKRINGSSSKYGFMAQRENHVSPTLSRPLESFKRFPSRLMEARHYLISLGKLII